MRIGLRWKILLLTVLTPITLAVAVLLMVNRDVAEHADSSSLHENLGHSAAVFEGMLATRMRALAGGAQVVAQDPRFFSLLMLGVSQRDARFAATVRGMAHDFNRITQTEVFEVFDRRGKLLASVGDAQSSHAARQSLLDSARLGQVSAGILTEPRAHFQAVAVPVRADGRVVGVLLLGAEIGPALAEELHAELRCEVSFLSSGVITGTTLRSEVAREALLQTLRKVHVGPGTGTNKQGIIRMRVGRGHDYLTIVRPIPGTPAEAGQYYVMQRSFDPESLFQLTVRNDVGEGPWDRRSRQRHRSPRRGRLEFREQRVQIGCLNDDVAVDVAEIHHQIR